MLEVRDAMTRLPVRTLHADQIWHLQESWDPATTFDQYDTKQRGFERGDSPCAMSSRDPKISIRCAAVNGYQPL